MEYFEMDITEKEKDLYGDKLILLTGTLTEFLSCMEMLRRYRKAVTGRDPVSSCRARIKKADSMTEKLRRMGLEVCRENALQKVYDAAGVRIICPFVEDVYSMVDLIMEIPGGQAFSGKGLYCQPEAQRLSQLPHDHPFSPAFYGRGRSGQQPLAGAAAENHCHGLLGQYRAWTEI